MDKKVLDGVEIAVIGLDDVTDAESLRYIDYVRERTTEPLKKIEVVGREDGSVDVNYELQGPRFERIRRITGRDARKAA